MLISIPRKFAKQAGEADPGTRFYRRKGSHAEMTAWLEDMCEYIGPCVSPGGAANYAAVTRAGVHKRLKVGKLTAFCFEIIGQTKTRFGGTKKLKELGIVYIPFAECRAWRKELEGNKEAEGNK